MKQFNTATVAPPRRGNGGTDPTPEPQTEIQPKLQMIQALIPVALERIEELLQQEVAQLAGPRYSHNDPSHDYKRWGKQRGAVYLAGQKVALMVPRVRDVRQKREVPLEIYQQLQQPGHEDEKLFVKILNGLACRKFEPAERLLPDTFSLSRSTEHGLASLRSQQRHEA